MTLFISNKSIFVSIITIDFEIVNAFISFDKVMDIVDNAVNNLRTRDLVDFDDAEFELNYNNQVELTDVRVDTDYIINTIREELENIFEETADEDGEEGTLTDIPVEYQ